MNTYGIKKGSAYYGKAVRTRIKDVAVEGLAVVSLLISAVLWGIYIVWKLMHICPVDGVTAGIVMLTAFCFSCITGMLIIGMGSWDEDIAELKKQARKEKHYNEHRRNH